MSLKLSHVVVCFLRRGEDLTLDESACSLGFLDSEYISVLFSNLNLFLDEYFGFSALRIIDFTEIFAGEDDGGSLYGVDVVMRESGAGIIS